METNTATTVSPIERVITHEEWGLGSDTATVTGPKGKTKVLGCFGISESGRYRVTYTYMFGRVLMRTSTVVEAESGIAASIIVAQRGEGSYVTCDAGTVEMS